MFGHDSTGTHGRAPLVREARTDTKVRSVWEHVQSCGAMFVFNELENVQCCLDFLHAQKVQGLEQVTAADIRDAKLKAVLALFFALSRHKQATKQRTAPSTGTGTNASKNSSEDVSLNAVQRITGGSSCDEILTACGNNVEMTTLTANSKIKYGTNKR
ncbi:hypothetical protein SFRURICE_004598 [Spodoptera frugiperda]|nr:hypothetical protein SFRURICE_004598 [Spodoptera frugiperda]